MASRKGRRFNFYEDDDKAAAEAVDKYAPVDRDWGPVSREIARNAFISAGSGHDAEAAQSENVTFDVTVAAVKIQHFRGAFRVIAVGGTRRQRAFVRACSVPCVFPPDYPGPGLANGQPEDRLRPGSSFMQKGGLRPGLFFCWAPAFAGVVGVETGHSTARLPRPPRRPYVASAPTTAPARLRAC